MNQINVIPAEAGIQSFKYYFKVDTRLKRYNENGVQHRIPTA